MPIKGVGEVTLFAPDPEGYWTWLTTAMGAVLTRRSAHLIQGVIASVPVTVHPADAKSPAGPGAQVVYWLVENLEEVLAHLQAHGAHPYRGPIVGEDGVRVAQVQDPWGNVWGFLEEGDGHGK
ncbi:MAG: hypothetical protein OWU84_13935 [Firmicutes bacterium]|nr:hypothetical protein [Bacillota bacterium]